MFYTRAERISVQRFAHVLSFLMTYSLKDLDVARRQVTADRQMIFAQQNLIDGMLTRGEPAGLARASLVTMTEALRNHRFHQDLIQASIRLQR